MPDTSPDQPVDFTCLSASATGALVHVVLSRPPVNAVSQAMYTEIRDVFSTLDERFPHAKVVVLRGAGRHFCAGNDLHEFADMTPATAARHMRLVREAFSAVYECPVPTIAAVHGSALGTGVALASSCDIVVADAEARFGTPEVTVGVMGGGRHLARLVPEQLMRQMYFTGEVRSAAEISQYGSIISAQPGQLDAAVEALTSSIAQHSRTVLRYAKESLNRSEFLPLRTAYELEQQMTIRLVSEPDSQEARQAVVERRQPHYRD